MLDSGNSAGEMCILDVFIYLETDLKAIAHYIAMKDIIKKLFIIVR